MTRGVTECYTSILEMYTSPLDSHLCMQFFLNVEDETNDEDNNESVKAGPRAELTQFVKRKKPPVHLDRIVDCLHYKVYQLLLCISLGNTVTIIRHFQQLFLNFRHLCHIFKCFFVIVNNV